MKRMRFLIVVLICFLGHSASFANDTLPKPFGLEFGTPKSDLMHLKSDNYDQSRWSAFKKNYQIVRRFYKMLIENPPRKPSDSTYFFLRFDRFDRLEGVFTYLDVGTDWGLSLRAYNRLKDILIKKYASNNEGMSISQDGTPKPYTFPEPYTIIYGDGVEIHLSMRQLEESEYIVTISYTRAPALVELSGY